MDTSRELEGTQEETEELTDEQLAAIAAEDDGEDIPVYHLDMSTPTDTEAVEALLEETAEKAEEVSLIERPAEEKPEKAVDKKPDKAVDEDGKKPRIAAEEKLPARPVEVERGVRNSFGALAMRRGLITQDQLDAALERQKQSKKKLGAILVELGSLSSQQTAEILAEQLHIDFFDVRDYVYDPGVADLIPERLVERYSVLPLRRQGNKLYVVTSDPLDFQAIENIRLATGLSVVPVLGLEEEIKKVIFKYFGSHAAEDALELLSADDDVATDTAEDLSLSYNDAPIVSLVNTILESAIREQASDIHMEPTPTNMRIRQRIDGVLHQSMTVPKKVQPLVTSRIKIMGKLDIAEKRRPQDGKIKVFVDKREVDIRLSSVPTVFGEKLVMRLLDKSRGIVPIDRLGMTDDEMSRVRRMISSPNGVILLTGPTGSGKTTTLYSMISEINKPDINILTVEDPVEYQLEGLNQVNVNKKAGLTFASALRSFLRQDPDVIMVGEIRDKETAEIAVQAALTGHLVLSTIHTNDAPATVSRLQNMGVEPFLISASITGIVSQRLVRTICPNCAEEVEYDEEKLKSVMHYLPKGTEYHFKVGRGCATCHQTGYKGRTAIYEVLLVTAALREAVVAGKDTEELREIAQAEGMKLLVECGMLRAAKGITTIEEVLRVARVEDVANADL
ncbi:Flp pilus assembly complex ATPase component TadA [bacterium]|nr:Flp pilus assembly complex ATPase component TadA [bacterium]